MKADKETVGCGGTGGGSAWELIGAVVKEQKKERRKNKVAGRLTCESPTPPPPSLHIFLCELAWMKVGLNKASSLAGKLLNPLVRVQPSTNTFRVMALVLVALMAIFKTECDSAVAHFWTCECSRRGRERTGAGPETLGWRY